MSADEMVVWLRGVLDEDERVANEALSHPSRWKGTGWERTGTDDGVWTTRPGPGDAEGCRVEGIGITIYDEGGHGPEQARHIARNAPHERLLAIAAIRQAVDDYETANRATMIWVNKHLASGNREDGEQAQRRGEYEDRLRLVVEYAALQYAHRPGYRLAWRPVTAPSLPYSEYLRYAAEGRGEARP